MTRTIQKTRIEKAIERQEMIQKADKDQVLYWHLESIKKELHEEIKETFVF